jgi:hypothetical protein
MEERSRITLVGASLYSKIPRDFKLLHNPQPGEYFMWTYDEEASTAFLRLIRPKKPKPEAAE